MNFLRAPFSFYQQLLDVTETTTRRGLEYGQQATRQTMDVAESTAQRGLEQAHKAMQQRQQAVQKTGE